MSFRIKNIGVRIKEYFGFVETNVTWRQRWRHFLASERRSFARLIGAEPRSRSCTGRSDEPGAK